MTLLGTLHSKRSTFMKQDFSKKIDVLVRGIIMISLGLVTTQEQQKKRHEIPILEPLTATREEYKTRT
jgi:hypothetical protein